MIEHEVPGIVEIPEIPDSPGLETRATNVSETIEDAAIGRGRGNASEVGEVEAKGEIVTGIEPREEDTEMMAESVKDDDRDLVVLGGAEVHAAIWLHEVEEIERRRERHITATNHKNMRNLARPRQLRIRIKWRLTNPSHPLSLASAVPPPAHPSLYLTP